jgi:8-oxo-dGTP diphosphatase
MPRATVERVAQIEVVGAVLVDGGGILAARRGPDMNLPGMWEFPGGKVEAGETHQEALRRELVEELGCTVEVGGLVASTDHGHVTLTTYFCTLVDGTPEPTEHSELRWLSPGALAELEWAPADIPTVRLLAGGALHRLIGVSAGARRTFVPAAMRRSAEHGTPTREANDD